MRKLLFVLGITLLFILVAAPGAGAASSAAVAGEWTWVNTGGEEKAVPVDHGLLEAKAVSGWGTEDGTWTGTFAGTSKDAFNYVGTASGIFLGTLTADFEGKVNGVAGTMTMRMNFYASPATVIMTGHWAICEAGGGLAGLRGTGTWSQYPGQEMENLVAYTGMVRMP
jgi:hypothetical protein